MTDNYTQTVELKMSGNTRLKQILGLVLILLGVGLFAVAATANWFITIPAVFLVVGGGVYLHLFNKTAKEYVYGFNYQRLVISKKDSVNRQKRILSVEVDKIISFEIMQSLPNVGDTIAVADVGEMGVYELTFSCENGESKLFFKPDEYMVALINDCLDSRKSVKSVNNSNSIVDDTKDKESNIAYE